MKSHASLGLSIAMGLASCHIAQAKPTTFWVSPRPAAAPTAQAASVAPPATTASTASPSAATTAVIPTPSESATAPAATPSAATPAALTPAPATSTNETPVVPAVTPLGSPPTTSAPGAATAPAPPSPTTTTVPIPSGPPQPLRVTLIEQQYFDLGYSLAKSAFSYADLAKQAEAIPTAKDRATQLQSLAALAPVAAHDRNITEGNLKHTVTLLRSLNASPDAIAAIEAQAEALGHPLELTDDAKQVAALNPGAGQTLAALDEFERVGGLTETPAIMAWLNGPKHFGAGNVWYAEGMIAGVAGIAAAEEMPDLLPTADEVSTDLCGLRDWITIRMPSQPTVEAAALRDALDAFLKVTDWPKVAERPVSDTELTALGSISEMLQQQVLERPATDPDAPPSASPPAQNPAAPTPPPSPATNEPAPATLTQPAGNVAVVPISSDQPAVTTGSVTDHGTPQTETQQNTSSASDIGNSFR